ncbi:MAG TPA: ankyrin repeat domain-containing protein [Thermoanaerobaculia bacterium]|jgi:peptide-methionine (S)-S-oxide reductase|nr:ankyrin repeat domain-containing protein [Thermoanaerobaculia bacterium]
MDLPEIPDSTFREAVAAIDSGDVSTLERLLATHPALVRDRLDYGGGYFRQPYLLWFVAENPIRNGRLPQNIAQMARAIVEAAERQGVASLREQLDYALGLVCSGRVARECGVQRELIDVLMDAGAHPDGAMLPALAHREVAAAERLLERGAALTLTAAVCTDRTADILRLGPVAGDRQTALAAAALYGQAQTLTLLIDLGVEVSAYSPPGFHPHGTALHHAVDSGQFDAVKVLVEAGANLSLRDRIYDGTPLDWAIHLQRMEIAAYLRGRAG